VGRHPSGAVGPAPTRRRVPGALRAAHAAAGPVGALSLARVGCPACEFQAPF
jgi:hypothetical protein